MGERPWLVLVESNTTGSGRLFCSVARRLGMRPIVLTANPSRYPYLRDDRVDHRVVDTSDLGAVLSSCTGLRRVAGVTSSSEYFIATAAVVAARLGLPAPDVATVTVCRDKARQRAALAASGVQVPAFRPVSTVAQAVAAACELDLPLVVKPTSGSGSVGVRRCATLHEVATGARAAMSGASRRALVEQYVPGSEYSVETFDGDVVGVTRKHLGREPHFVEIGHDFPAPLADADRRALADAARAALSALDLTWGAAHVELRLGTQGPVVIEVNPRLAGGMIPALVLEAGGGDLVERCVRAAAGLGPPSPGVRTNRAASIRFVVAVRAGQVTSVRGLGYAAALPGVRRVEMTVGAGHRIAAIEHSFRDRLGYVIAAGDDVASTAMAADEAVRRITVDVT